MKSDADTKRDVEEELHWSPNIDDTDIAVKVMNGVVSLTGFVRNFSEKYHAEAAAKRVAGVAGVANDIEVHFPAGDDISDPEIARNTVAAIKNELPFIDDRVKVLVHKGRVTLEGHLEWQFQKQQAEDAARRQKGVMNVLNLIEIRPCMTPKGIERQIHSAFHRSAQIDADRVSVTVDGSSVTLSGRVRSWAERMQAEDTAWRAPGVTQVKNEIDVAI
jgi:osmotically-inducible protein OsmY